MRKFAFQQRTVVLTEVWFEAETESEAWAKALAGELADGAGDRYSANAPVFRRKPKLDEFDL